MVFVSHNLDEVLEIADEVSVFRDGQLVRTAPVQAWSKESCIEAMLGSATASTTATSTLGDTTDEELLSVENLTVPGVVHDVSLRVRRGRILGIAGLVGSGEEHRSEVTRRAGAPLGGIDSTRRDRRPLAEESACRTPPRPRTTSRGPQEDRAVAAAECHGQHAA